MATGCVVGNVRVEPKLPTAFASLNFALGGGSLPDHSNPRSRFSKFSAQVSFAQGKLNAED
jgi:hypothetical protein